MTASISVTPAAAPAAPTAAAISVSADLAKAYADALAEAKAEIANVEAALKGEGTTVTTWLKANWAHVVTWAGVATTAVPAAIAILKHL